MRLPNETERVRLFGDKKHPTVTIIPNAWDTYPSDRREKELTDTILSFTERGYIPTVLDIRASEDKQGENIVLSSDFLWVMGGNSLYLNYYVRKTGFDDIFRQALRNGTVYGGMSAGAILAGPTLRGAEYADNPKDASQTIWDGLGFVDFGIVPHWGMDKYMDILEKVADGMRSHVAQLFTLTNDQAVLVIDKAVTVA